MSEQDTPRAQEEKVIRTWVKRELFEQVPMSICVIDKGLRVAACNKNFSAIFGDPAGKTCYQAYKNAPTACDACAAHRTFRDGVSRISETHGVDCLGQRADYVVHHSPIVDDRGQIAFVVNMSYDITERKSVQSQYNFLFDRVPCSLSVIRRDYRIIRANEHARARFGEVVGTRCYQTFKKREAACDRCPAQKTFADGRIHTSQEVRWGAEGVCSHYFVSTAPMGEDGQGVSHVMEMSLDITQIHELSEELERQHRMRHEITESSLDALVAVDTDGQVTLFNAAAESLFGKKRQDVLYRKIGHELLPLQFFEQIRDGVSSVLLRDTHVDGPRGEKIPVRLSATVLRQGQKVVGGAAFLQDLRERKELERQMLRNERMAAIGHTMTQLAHSIKNILTGIQGGIYDVKKGCERDDGPRRDEGLATLERNFARIHSMVRDFLRLSKDHELELAECDANQIAKDVVELFRPQAQRLGITLLFEPWPSSLAVMMDADAIHTCLSNLLSNALEACLNIPGACQVGISVGWSESTLRYEVWDSGCGMSHDVMEKLFHPFFTTKGQAGTGLGLMMSKKIIEDHGGNVKVISQVGKGARFTVLLPMQESVGGAEGDFRSSGKEDSS